MEYSSKTLDELNADVMDENLKVKYAQNDKRATITGLKAGTTYVLIAVANDSLIVGSFKVEVRPADEVTSDPSKHSGVLANLENVHNIQLSD